MRHKTKIVKTKYFDYVDTNVGGRSIHEDISKDISKDILSEICETVIILQKGMVGEFLYNKALETIKKYPQYFPKHVIKDNVIYSKYDKATSDEY
jgi:hypothetical protein